MRLWPSWNLLSHHHSSDSLISHLDFTASVTPALTFLATEKKLQLFKIQEQLVKEQSISNRGGRAGEREGRGISGS